MNWQMQKFPIKIGELVPAGVIDCRGWGGLLVQTPDFSVVFNEEDPIKLSPSMDGITALDMADCLGNPLEDLYESVLIALKIHVVPFPLPPFLIWTSKTSTAALIDSEFVVYLTEQPRTPWTTYPV